jgi:conjugative transfer signal peptidase TraF
LRRPSLYAGVAIAAVLGFIDLFVEPHIAFNHTASMPRGFYWLSSVPVTGARSGDIVIACPPPAFAIYGRTHEFLDIGPCDGATTVIKHVVAMAGDRVHLGATGVRVNGHLIPNSAPLRRDARGALVPHIAHAAYVVRDHQVWLIGDDMRSFDSRYFGAVDRALNIAQPFLTIPSPS